MWRIRVALAVVAVAGVAAIAVVASSSATAKASSTSLVGKWKGTLRTTGATQGFQVSVKSNERSGTWRASATCSGTLKLKDISDGYHHYYRLGGHGCAPAGVDCLKRAGAGVLDWFDENTGNISYVGTLKRY